MSASDDTARPATRTTEITLVTGERRCVEGAANEVERSILDAARGSILQFAWFTEADTQDALGVNPEHVVALRAGGSRTTLDVRASES